jgi:hypothetical protein
VAKDGRLYARFTLDFADNAKILPLSDAAFRCLVEATLWSREHMTDGWLAKRLALAKWSLDALHELSANDAENPSLEESESGWQIRDFALHQDTKAEIEERRERNKTAGQRGGLAKAKRSAKRSASESLSENVAETETKTTEVTTHVVTSRPRNERGTRLPDDWRPLEAAYVVPDGVDVHAEYAKFCDYWRAQPGTKGRKTDWEATWRNWLRRAAETTTRPRAPNGGHDDKVNSYLAFANQPSRPEIEA